MKILLTFNIEQNAKFNDGTEKNTDIKFGIVVRKGAVKSEYRKNSKNWDTLNYHRDCPTNGIVAFYSAILRSKDSDRITNRVDTDQTAP